MYNNLYKMKLNQFILLNFKNNVSKNSLKKHWNFIKYKFNINKYLYLIISNLMYMFFKFYTIINFSKNFNFYLNYYFYYY